MQNDAGMTPCSVGHLNVVKVLVSELKADVSCTDSTGRTPLHRAD